MKKLITFLLISAAAVSAQSILGVRYPGGLTGSKTGISARMGGFGIGSDESYLMMAHNPGNLGNIKSSVYSLKLTLDYTRAKENDLSSDFVSLTPDLVGFAFPLGNIGTFGLGFSRERGNKYTFMTPEGVLATNSADTSETVTGWTSLYRKSSITSWEIGWGHKAWKFFRPGLTYRRYYLNIEDNRVTKVDNFGGTGDSVSIKQTGNSIRGGFSGTVGKFTYGLTGTYNFKSDAKFNKSVTEITETDANGRYNTSLHHENASDNATYKLHLPPSGGAGVSYQINEKMLVGVDFSMELWDRAYTNAGSRLFFDEYTNTQSGSVGFQFIPAPQLLAPRYFEKIRYSGGFRAATLPIDGDYEMAGSFGVGLPLGSTGLLDFGFEIGGRRSRNEDSIKENFLKFNISTSGGKQWKKRSGNLY